MQRITSFFRTLTTLAVTAALAAGLAGCAAPAEGDTTAVVESGPAAAVEIEVTNLGVYTDKRIMRLEQVGPTYWICRTYSGYKQGGETCSQITEGEYSQILRDVQEG